MGWPHFMGYRSKIVEVASDWAYPGEWKPTAEELVKFFKGAGTKEWPSIDEAEEALKKRSTGVKVNGQVKHWCGVFACFLLREAGLTFVSWDLGGGHHKIKQLEKVWGSKGMQRGDLAAIALHDHHFIVMESSGSQARENRCLLAGKTEAPRHPVRGSFVPSVTPEPADYLESPASKRRRVFFLGDAGDFRPGGTQK